MTHVTLLEIFYIVRYLRLFVLYVVMNPQMLGLYFIISSTSMAALVSQAGRVLGTGLLFAPQALANFCFIINRQIHECLSKRFDPPSLSCQSYTFRLLIICLLSGKCAESV
ncbi:hypothetical protein V1525DRAFT_41961 [Lipomyces kononenkoae]|uniref:Uncharacterized protein n=1 Tax=Lipomyces kononenkoae TaxID=34357 RepID=A0ACC3SST0_LIPKO